MHWTRLATHPTTAFPSAVQPNTHLTFVEWESETPRCEKKFDAIDCLSFVRELSLILPISDGAHNGAADTTDTMSE